MDEWIDVTAFGREPEHVLARNGVDVRIAVARAKYLEDQISAEDFERAIEQALDEARLAAGLLPSGQ